MKVISETTSCSKTKLIGQSGARNSTVENFILDSAHQSLITIARRFIRLQENVIKSNNSAMV